MPYALDIVALIALFAFLVYLPDLLWLGYQWLADRAKRESQ